MTALSRLGGIAVELAEADRYVFPLGRGSKKPAIPSAHPKGDPLHRKCRGGCGRDGHGLYDGTVDVDRIIWWWTTDPRCGPECNVGVATEPSRLVVGDLDPTNDDDGHCSDALAALCALAADIGGGDLPPTLEVMTPRRGEHWYFAVPEGVESPPSSVGTVAPHIDIRSAGAYVVGAGSVVSEGRYDVARDVPVVDVPGWFANACRRAERADRFESPPPGRTVPPAGQFSTDRRNRWASKALEGEIGRLAMAPVGQRHRRLYLSAHALGGLVAAGALPAHDVAGELTHVARRIGLDDDEIETTIADGVASGMARPRQVPA